ncbi:short-chain dehydrogenase [Rhizobium wuzhouense]|uniref:Short-chain dehydrogenase n=2 Tax=Rhizobium wuzhouense TaxID=1986026 RepID=A0ABX5NZ50_9HYPH|nr:short-chain dehydrogenase [Rhizobium wuzhouense]
MSLKGRVAVVTGGAGHIGRAVAAGLAELGATVCLLDRSAEAADTAADGIRNDLVGARVECLCIDLESEDDRNQVAREVMDRFGRLDILVNNAGFVGDSRLAGWVTDFEQQSIETWRRAIEVNLTAAFHISQSLSGLLRASGHGSIVNVSSIYGNVGPDMSLYDGTAMGNPAAYAVSKGGVVQMTRWLSTVLAPDIRVNCVSPGGVSRGQPAPFIERYIARTPLRRMGREDDFVGAVCYFASDLSDWVTGQNLMVDGGWTAW